MCVLFLIADGLNCIKGASGKVIVDDKGIKDSWKEYMEKLINEENELVGISSGSWCHCLPIRSCL